MHLADLSLRNKIIIAIAVAGSCVAAAAVLTYGSMQQLQADTQWTRHTYEVLIELEAIEASLAELETGQRGFLLTGDPEYLRPYNKAGQVIDGHMDRLAALTRDNPVQQSNLLRLQPVTRARIQVLNDTLDVYRKLGLAAAVTKIKSNEGRDLMARARGIIDNMTGEEQRLLAIRSDNEKTSLDRNAFYITLGAAITLMFLVFISVLIRHDLVLRRQLRLTMEHLALQDALTELPNRVAFKTEIAAAVARAQRIPRIFAVLYFDLDGFKNINDTFGHQGGDEILKHVAVRVKRLLRANDYLARLGGDEFVILLDEIPNHADAGTAAQKILDAVARPIPLDNGKEGHVTASIGISIFPDHEVRPEELIQLADKAMYHAKNAGKNRFRFYARAATPG